MNIVLILTDDQRPMTLDQMPLTMSLLAGQGVHFVNAISTTPLCCPARATILSGLYAHNHGVLSNILPYGAPAFADVSTIATWLQSAGYRTALFGKYLNQYQLKQPWPYVPPGWSTWAAFKEPNYYNYQLVEDGREVTYGATAVNYSTRVLGAKAVAFIDSTPIDQPFFLEFAPWAPHAPATPANQDKTLFSNLPKWRPPSFNEADVSDKPAYVRALPRLNTSTIAMVDKLRLNQLRSLQAVDRWVKNIVDALIRTGRMDNTAIVFASDNGLALGEHRYLPKNCVYEGCIRVPLIIRAPGIAPRVDSNLVGLMDLTPTFAEWAGISPPIPVNGQSLTELLQNPGLPWRQEILIEVLAHAGAPAIEGLFSGLRTRRYTYAEYTTGERELYDLQTDPDQLTNVASDPARAALVAELSATLAGLKTE
jgi:arylsulfatase A-like enzyme